MKIFISVEMNVEITHLKNMIDITKNAWIAQTLDKFGYELSSILSLPYVSLCQIEKGMNLLFKKD
jgi:hypothetical protein